MYSARTFGISSLVSTSAVSKLLSVVAVSIGSHDSPAGVTWQWQVHLTKAAERQVEEQTIEGDQMLYKM